jgi:hypothetical protein
MNNYRIKKTEQAQFVDVAAWERNEAIEEFVDGIAEEEDEENFECDVEFEDEPGFVYTVEREVVPQYEITRMPKTAG